MGSKARSTRSNVTLLKIIHFVLFCFFFPSTRRNKYTVSVEFVFFSVDSIIFIKCPSVESFSYERSSFFFLLVSGETVKRYFDIVSCSRNFKRIFQPLFSKCETREFRNLRNVSFAYRNFRYKWQYTGILFTSKARHLTRRCFSSIN